MQADDDEVMKLPEHESPQDSGDTDEPPFERVPAIPTVDVSQGGSRVVVVTSHKRPVYNAFSGV